MLEFIPFIVSIVGLIVVFYMFRALIVFISDELTSTIATYKDDTASTSQRLNQLQISTQAQAVSIVAILEKAADNYQESTAAVIWQTKQIAQSLREIEKSSNRQKELENEIVRLKSILSRREKKNV